MNFYNCTFVFLRHGKTLPNPVDSLRKLAHLGHEQAINFKENYGNSFDKIISSSAIRAMQTVHDITEGKDSKEIISLDILYALPGEEENDELMRMGERHGYVSLHTYLEKEGDNSTLLHKIGQEGAFAIGEILGNISNKKILIVAHAVTINSLIYWMFQESSIATEASLHIQLGECQALEINTDADGKVANVLFIQ